MVRFEQEKLTITLDVCNPFEHWTMLLSGFGEISELLINNSDIVNNSKITLVMQLFQAMCKLESENVYSVLTKP